MIKMTTMSMMMMMMIMMMTYNQPTKMFLYSDHNNLCNHQNATNQNVSAEQKQWLCKCVIHIGALRFVRTHYGPMRLHLCYQLSCSAL